MKRRKKKKRGEEKLGSSRFICRGGKAGKEMVAEEEEGDVEKRGGGP